MMRKVLPRKAAICTVLFRYNTTTYSNLISSFIWKFFINYIGL